MARDSGDPMVSDPDRARNSVEETQILISPPVAKGALPAQSSPDETQILFSESDVTNIIRIDAPAKRPVFVDPSGRRGRRVRGWAYGIAVVVLLVVSAAWLSQLDGWAKPPAPTNSSVVK